jgi:hypothetical protein
VRVGALEALEDSLMLDVSCQGPHTGRLGFQPAAWNRVAFEILDIIVFDAERSEN